MDIVDDHGAVVRLRGVNLGGWLLIEPWILGLDENVVGSEKELWDLLAQRFGSAAMRDLMRTFRDHFITEADIRRIAELGFNCVRLPVWWRATDDPGYDGGLAYLDRCVEWCAQYGVYVIIDLHGAPGTQANKAVIAGEPADAGLWKKQLFKQKAVAWWRMIAERYRDQPAVAGYDLLNEAFSAPFDDMVALYAEMYRAIRAVDPRHIIIMEDGLIGYHRLPIPADRGWSNVVYSFHYYPQDAAEAFRAPGRIMPQFNRAGLSYGVPSYVGEFNTILHERGGAETFRRLVEVFDYYGWPWTFWTWKKIDTSWDNIWGIPGYYTTAPAFDPRADSLDAIQQAFRNMASDRSRENTLLRAAATTPVRWVAEESEPVPGSGGILLTLRTAVLAPGASGDLRMEWAADRPNAGYWMAGDRIAWTFDVPRAGLHEIGLRMANILPGNRVGVWVDGVRVAAAAVTNTGGWSRYADCRVARIRLGAGRHVIELDEADQEKSFINLRCAWLRPVAEGAAAALEDRMSFTALNMRLRRDSPVRVEWVNHPPNIGFWAPGETITWPVALEHGGTYTASIAYATPDADTTMQLWVDGRVIHEQALAATGGWQDYRTLELGAVQLAPGRREVALVWTARHAGSTGNFRELALERQAD